MNTIGNIYRVTTFGESHGQAIGGIIDGVPAGLTLDMEAVQQHVARRRPGQSAITTTRDEKDKVVFLSGFFEGKTTGCPIGFIVENNDIHSEHYDALRYVLRPSHADYTYWAKYGCRDYRGGGRASARETLSRCVAGGIAIQILQQLGVSIKAYTSQVGHISLPNGYEFYDLTTIDNNAVHCPDTIVAQEMEQLINDVRQQGDSIGGIVTCVAQGVPAGWGEPVFDKLHADLGKAILSINAAKGFEYGIGFEAACRRGSEINDAFIPHKEGITTRTNYSGGIQGGISNGNDIYFRVAFKPTPTILQPIDTVTTDGVPTTLCANGRHDPCIVPRAIPIVESMTAIVLLDHYLRNKATRL